MLTAGNAVPEWAPGDAVMTHPVPLRDQGTWPPRLIAPAGLLAREPPDVSCAAACPVPALTAGQVLEDELGLHAGERRHQVTASSSRWDRPAGDGIAR